MGPGLLNTVASIRLAADTFHSDICLGSSLTTSNISKTFW
jgi:hypothetical protein